MLNNPNVQIVLEQLQTILVFLERAVVQRQLAAFVAAVFVAWWSSNKLMPWVAHRFSVWGRLSGNVKRYWRTGAQIVGYNSFPLFGILAAHIATRGFLALGWHTGLLGESLLLFWVLLAYRVIVTPLSAARQYTRHFRYRLLVPLLGLLVTGRLFSILTNTSALSSTVLLTLFGNPIRLGPLVIVTVVLYFLFTVAGAVQTVILSFIIPRTTVETGMISAALTIGRYAIIAIGILFALSTLGVDTPTLAFISGGLSVGMGFGLQQVIANFVSGIILLFEQSLRPGDVVGIGDEMGVVENLSIRATTIRTLDDVDVIVPNSNLLASAVRTYSKGDRLVRVSVRVSTSHDSDPREVRDVLLEIARQHNLVQQQPEPAVFFTELGAGGIGFQLAVWLDDPLLTTPVTSELRLMILDELAMRKIVIQ